MREKNPNRPEAKERFFEGDISAGLVSVSSSGKRGVAESMGLCLGKWSSAPKLASNSCSSIRESRANSATLNAFSSAERWVAVTLEKV